MIELKVNGNQVSINENITIAEYIAQRKLKPEMIVIEHNFKILDKHMYEKTVLEQNDNLEILAYVGGGR